MRYRQPVGGRDADLPDYLAKGYVPADVSDGSVSKTQEYAVADAALGRWAERLGRASDAAELGARGRAYEKLYDPSSGFFRPKNADGSWAPMPPPTVMDDAYVEGNAWHYLWMVPHDPEGLAQTLGGPRRRSVACASSSSSETEQPLLGIRKYYWLSNEPDISAPFFFAVGSPGRAGVGSIDRDDLLRRWRQGLAGQ
jgi:putative alpha-1,2-mannosidase